ncbi:vesicle-associated protein 2-2-like [Silene latifolia]|uniref:vesicle-associated protein 2-2-like n=1 Tax=Silene latifolia TaxID=37657 RepID=UPI003D775D5C
MSHQLEIQPREIRFVVELGKQSKCSIRLVNQTDQYVAFKVKTTSPKKYCVRPNVGVVLPKATHEFVVIMQAPKEVPVDLICKDKFLIQNTIVPEGTLEENITSEMFSRDNERYIEERKLRVILSTPPPTHAPASLPIDGTQEKVNGHVESKTVNKEELKPVKDAEDIPVYNVQLEPIKNARFDPTNVAILNALLDVELGVGSKFDKDIEPTTRKIAEVPVIEPRVSMGEHEQRLVKEVEEMKLKLHELESKLNKTETTTSKLTEERRLAIQERESLLQEMAILRKRKVERRVHGGFPLLFVCMVALISLVVGYGFHP